MARPVALPVHRQELCLRRTRRHSSRCWCASFVRSMWMTMQPSARRASYLRTAQLDCSRITTLAVPDVRIPVTPASNMECKSLQALLKGIHLSTLPRLTVETATLLLPKSQNNRLTCFPTFVAIVVSTLALSLVRRERLRRRRRMVFADPLDTHSVP